MKKINIVSICVIIALVFGIIGFMIGINVNGISKNESNLVGTYKTNSWNGKEAVLVLQKDKTMIHPMGYNGTWLIDAGKVYIEYDYIDTVAQSADEMIAMFSEENQQTSEKNYMKIHIFFYRKKKPAFLSAGSCIILYRFYQVYGTQCLVT